jgi:hypothetical protein
MRIAAFALDKRKNSLAGTHILYFSFIFFCGVGVRPVVHLWF